MTLDLKIAFLLSFFALWAVLGSLPWLVAAVARRGQGAGLALPMALGGSWAGGVLVPFLGADDAAGFLVSLATCAVGGLVSSEAGFFLARHMGEAGNRQVENVDDGDGNNKRGADGSDLPVHHVGSRPL